MKLNYTIISDKENNVRRKTIYQEFKKIGVYEPNYTDAIMATRWTMKEVYRHIIFPCYLTKGEVGCVLSHKKVYKNFLETTEKSILIFEDDAVFTKECNYNILEKILEFINSLEYPAVIALQKSKWEGEQVFSINEKLSIHMAHMYYCTHGYAINRKAAENIIKLQTPIRFEIDAFELYNYLGIARLYSLNQDLVIQSNHFESTIGNERFYEDNQEKRAARECIRTEHYKDAYKRVSFRQKVNGIKAYFRFWKFKRLRNQKRRIKRFFGEK